MRTCHDAFRETVESLHSIACDVCRVGLLDSVAVSLRESVL